MDREQCLLILEGHVVDPNMRQLIRHFLDEARNVCRTSGNYGTPFKAGCGVTQGGPLSAKLFTIYGGCGGREWLRILERGDGPGGERAGRDNVDPFCDL